MSGASACLPDLVSDSGASQALPCLHVDDTSSVSPNSPPFSTSPPAVSPVVQLPPSQNSTSQWLLALTVHAVVLSPPVSWVVWAAAGTDPRSRGAAWATAALGFAHIVGSHAFLRPLRHRALASGFALVVVMATAVGVLPIVAYAAGPANVPAAANPTVAPDRGNCVPLSTFSTSAFCPLDGAWLDGLGRSPAAYRWLNATHTIAELDTTVGYVLAGVMQMSQTLPYLASCHTALQGELCRWMVPPCSSSCKPEPITKEQCLAVLAECDVAGGHAVTPEAEANVRGAVTNVPMRVELAPLIDTVLGFNCSMFPWATAQPESSGPCLHPPKAETYHEVQPANPRASRRTRSTFAAILAVALASILIFPALAAPCAPKALLAFPPVLGPEAVFAVLRSPLGFATLLHGAAVVGLLAYVSVAETTSGTAIVYATLCQFFTAACFMLVNTGIHAALLPHHRSTATPSSVLQFWLVNFGPHGHYYAHRLVLSSLVQLVLQCTVWLRQLHTGDSWHLLVTVALISFNLVSLPLPLARIAIHSKRAVLVYTTLHQFVQFGFLCTNAFLAKEQRATAIGFLGLALPAISGALAARSALQRQGTRRASRAFSAPLFPEVSFGQVLVINVQQQDPPKRQNSKLLLLVLVSSLLVGIGIALFIDIAVRTQRADTVCRSTIGTRLWRRGVSPKVLFHDGVLRPSRCAWETIVTISAQQSDINYLPESISCLTALRTLRIARNSLAHLPESLGRLRSLETLDLTDNLITHLPSSIWSNSKLNLRVHGNPVWYSLDLSSLGLREVPQVALASFPALRELILSGNPLGSWPTAVATSFPALEVIECSNCGLVAVPPLLQAFPKLTRLNLSDNPLAELDLLPTTPKNPIAGSRGSLDVSGTALEQVPYLPGAKLVVGRNPQMQMIDWVGANVTTLEKSLLQQLPQLSRIRISVSPLASLPDELWDLRDLTVLDVNSANISAISERIADLPKLTYLDVSYTPLRHLPHALLYGTPRLETLVIESLRLPRSEFAALIEQEGHPLRKLRIGYNWLGEVPRFSDTLRASVEVAFMSHNNISSVPVWLWDLPKLNSLDLSSNPLPSDILAGPACNSTVHEIYFPLGTEMELCPKRSCSALVDSIVCYPFVQS